MKLAVASGKGGTGKTTVATNLACVAARSGLDVTYLDLDVEEPNAAIFLKPQFEEDRAATAPVPGVDHQKCTGCGQCGRICQFSAIVSMNRTVLTFPELCHGCAGCWLACPAGAIRQDAREIGRVQAGSAGGIRFVQGVLNIGQAMSPPLIRAVKAAAVPPGSTNQAALTVLDCPPGTSCPMIEAVRGADYVLLVAEPTPFGLSDLKLAVETVGKLELPFGVLINRSDCGDDQTRRYCRDEGIAVLAEIPDVRAVAEAYSRGVMASEVSRHYAQGFQRLLEALRQKVAR